jgi:phage/plasmid primase-like uncharacterized protein
MPFHNVDQLQLAAAGRWADILIAAGIPAKVLDGRNHPCPKCGGRDRFAAFRDCNERGAVHCRHCFTHGSAIPPCDGIATIRWWLNLSFLDALSFLSDVLRIHPNHTGNMTPNVLARREPSDAFKASLAMTQEMIKQHTEFARDAYRRFESSSRNRLARCAMVSEQSLISLRVGITSDRNASTWPMRNERGQVIGVRIVALPWIDRSSGKWSRRGSQNGIFNSAETPRADTRLFITEGASDTAAAISLGLWAIGRSSCNTSTFFVDRFIHLRQPSRLTLIADNDAPGINGATRLAKSLCENLPESLRSVEVIAPPNPGSDLRSWIADGADEAAIRNAGPIRSKTSVKQTVFEFEV